MIFKQIKAKIYLCKRKKNTFDGIGIYNVVFSIKDTAGTERVYNGTAQGYYTFICDSCEQGNLIREYIISFHITKTWKCIIDNIEI